MVVFAKTKTGKTQPAFVCERDVDVSLAVVGSEVPTKSGVFFAPNPFMPTVTRGE